MRSTDHEIILIEDQELVGLRFWEPEESLAQIEPVQGIRLNP